MTGGSSTLHHSTQDMKCTPVTGPSGTKLHFHFTQQFTLKQEAL